MQTPKLAPNVRKLLILSLFVAASLILSWLERLIPMPAMIPGLKIGLANATIILVLQLCGFRNALMVSTVRIVLVSLLFGSLAGMVYSFCGALLSLCGMWLLGRTRKFGIAGISAAGGALHNLGQIGAACLMVGSAAPFAYLPLLIIGGVVCGLLIGIAGAILIRRIGPLLCTVFDVPPEFSAAPQNTLGKDDSHD